MVRGKLCGDFSDVGVVIEDLGFKRRRVRSEDKESTLR